MTSKSNQPKKLPATGHWQEMLRLALMQDDSSMFLPEAKSQKPAY